MISYRPIPRLTTTRTGVFPALGAMLAAVLVGAATFGPISAQDRTSGEGITTAVTIEATTDAHEAIVQRTDYRL